MSIPSFYFSPKWYALRRKVLKRDGWICRYCGEPACQADHVIPRSKGGPDTMKNLVACCPVCNRVAGGRQFPSLKAKRYWILRQRGIKVSTVKKQESGHWEW